jgi:Xaa-Pro aminopeptidase
VTIALDRPAISTARYGERLDLARGAMTAQGVTALLVGVGADLRYLIGYVANPSERLTMLVLPEAGPAGLIAPHLESMAAAECPAAAAGLVDIVRWDETDDPHGLVADRLAAALGGIPPSGRMLVSGGLWAMHVLGLQRALPGRSFGLATEVTRELRMTKDPEEVALLRLAAEAADRAMGQIVAGPLVGRTERDVSLEIQAHLIAEGHESADFAIVASGPNSASPHHHATDRRIEAGEPIVLDIGGTLDGYASDTTRTIWVTGSDAQRLPTEEFHRIHALVQEAQEAATAAVRPGIACEAVDAVARDVITAGGHGPDFFHRVGHGIGLEGHEEPYLVAGNPEPLRAGVAFSIEPGIYLPGRYGVRIEDIVVCGDDGPLVLNQSMRSLQVVSG